MAGTLEITDELCWMPAGWVFDNVLESVATYVGNTDSSLAAQLLDGHTQHGSGYVDLRSITDQEFALIIQGVDNCLQVSLQAGANSFYDPAFFEGFINQVKKFRDMLISARH